MNMPKLQNLITETFLQIFSKVFKINFKNLEFLFKQIKKALDIRAFFLVWEQALDKCLCSFCLFLKYNIKDELFTKQAG